jgi:hypothetical protein
MTTEQYNAQIAPLDEQISTLRSQIEALHKPLRDEIEVQEHIASGGIDPKFMLIGDVGSMVKHREQERQYLKLFGGYYGCVASGYFTETGQKVVRVAMIKGNERHTQMVLRGLEFLLPHILPHPSDGSKLVDIFEHTLSEYSSLYLHVFDDRVELRDHRGYRRKGDPLKTFGDLSEALRYVANHHWYESAEEEAA